VGEVIAEVLGGLAQAAVAAAVHVGGGFVRWVAAALGVELWDRWERRGEE
jgi:hypothetical protein